MIELFISAVLLVGVPIALLICAWLKSKWISDFEAAQRMAGVYVEDVSAPRLSIARLLRSVSFRCNS